ncbi:MAG: 50S ribosomal protein L13 [Candidatus Coatesbacteria bacterium]|nr:50S ribosomal protein L13 [Candidatus Coatesbacteria bacterium]
MATYHQKQAEVERKWFVVDAADVPLGRLATRVAQVLSGKHKPTWSPHLDDGDFVIVVNAAAVKLTGNKLTQKVHYSYSGYPGGLKEQSYDEVMEKYPERAVHWAVKGMLPKNRLAAKMAKRLRVFAGSEHNHQAQRPEELSLES